MKQNIQNKSSTRCKTAAYCDNCKTDVYINTPRDKEVLWCPCCKAKLVRESIKYV